MTDNEIIKADELISKLHKYCLFSQMKVGELNTFTDSDFDCLHNLIDTINRQKAEIEENKLKIDHQAQIIRTLETALADKMAEIERLSHKCEDCAGCNQWHCDCANERAEAIKEFAERLKDEFVQGIRVYNGYASVKDILRNIDNLVKEMTGEKEREN